MVRFVTAPCKGCGGVVEPDIQGRVGKFCSNPCYQDYRARKADDNMEVTRNKTYDSLPMQKTQALRNWFLTGCIATPVDKLIKRIFNRRIGEDVKPPEPRDDD